MAYFGILGFIFAIVAFVEVVALKKRVNALESKRETPSQ